MLIGKPFDAETIYAAAAFEGAGDWKTFSR
jgi:hypothetical protein